MEEYEGNMCQSKSEKGVYYQVLDEVENYGHHTFF